MGKFGVNRSDAFKVLCTCSRNTPLRSKKQHSHLGQSNSFPVMCIFPLLRGRFVYFGLAGSYTHWCTFHTLLDLLVTDLVYIQPDIEWPKQLGDVKMACLKVCHAQLGRLLNDVTSASRVIPNQLVIRSQKHRSWTFSGHFLNISSRPKTGIIWRVVDLFWFSDKCSAKLLEAS